MTTDKKADFTGELCEKFALIPNNKLGSDGIRTVLSCFCFSPQVKFAMILALKNVRTKSRSSEPL
jgi:hypothetical protein